MPEIHELSQAAFDRLKDEYDYLTTEWRIEIAKKIEAARELGDLSENGDYHAAKEEQGKMEGRIMRLQQIMENHRIIEGGGSEDVQIGSEVEIRYEGDSDTEKYLLGNIEEERDGVQVMSPGSPIGQALVGAKAGDKVSYETPTGMTLTVEVVSVG